MGTVEQLKNRSISRHLPLVALYGAVGMMCTIIPVTLVLHPFVLLLLMPRAPDFNVKNFSSILAKIAIVHVFLAATPFFLKYDLFFKLLAFSWHAVATLFWIAYLASYKEGNGDISRRIRVFLGWSMACFGVVWIGVGADIFLWEGAAKQAFLHQIQMQAAYLRDALFQSKISPYQLPDSIQLLLEKGPELWAQAMIGQMLPALLGLMVATFFVYWNMLDIRVKNPSGVLLHNFRLPDWSMVVLVAWLALWLAAYSFKKSEAYAQVPALAWIEDVGWAGVFTTLWWYALEGVSLLIRIGARVKRFWVFFILVLLLFFSVQVAEIILMGVGLGAQIRRFMPKRP